MVPTLLSRLNVIFGIALFLVLLAPSLGTAAQAANDPPTRKSAKQRPMFRQLLKSTQYQQRFEKVWTRLGKLDQLEKTDRPVVGSRITQFAPNSQVEELGLEIGDIIEQVNGQLMWSSSFPYNDSRRRLRYFDVSENVMHTVRIEPGKIGIWNVLHWQPELGYLRKQSWRGAWDKQVLVGIVARETDPDLAETAWHQAVQLGYVRDYFSAQFGAVIALSQGRPDVAADFADFARLADSDKGELVHPLLLYRVAMANYQLTESLRLVRSYPLAFEIGPDVLLYEIDRHGRLSPDERSVLPPHQQAATMYKDDLLPRSTGRDYHSIRYRLPTVRRGDVLKMSASAGNYIYFRFGPSYPVRNIDLTVRVKAKPSSDAGTNWAKLVAVGLEYDAATQQGDILIIRLQEPVADSESGSIVRLSHSAGHVNLEYSDSQVRVDGTQEHEIRLIRVGGRGEIFLNGKRVLYGPVSSHAAPLNAFIRTIGMSIEVTSVQAFELIEKP
jgi:hypothetical protein